MALINEKLREVYWEAMKNHTMNFSTERSTPPDSTPFSSQTCQNWKPKYLHSAWILYPASDTGDHKLLTRQRCIELLEKFFFSNIYYLRTSASLVLRITLVFVSRIHREQQKACQKTYLASPHFGSRRAADRSRS